MLPFLHRLHRFQINTGLIERSKHCTCSGTGNQQLIPHIQLRSFYQKFCHTDIREVPDTLAYIYFPFRSCRTVILSPFAKALAQIVTVPEATVEYCFQPFIPCGNLFIGKRTVQIRTDCLFIALHYRTDILRSTGTPFYFEYPHACIQHLIHKMDGFQVFGRHDILIVHFQFHIRLFITYRVRAAAHLHTGTTVSRVVHLVK